MTTPDTGIVTTNQWRRETPTDERAAWVARHLERHLSTAEAALVGILCDALDQGPSDIEWHTLMRIGAARYAGIDIDWAMSSSDSGVGGLTRLVFAAHDACCRVAIRPRPGERIHIDCWLRRRSYPEDAFWHPTLEQAVADWRKKQPAPHIDTNTST